MKKLFVLLVGVIALASCTENERARRFGGTVDLYSRYYNWYYLFP